jgi:hypothetical protein
MGRSAEAAPRMRPQHRCMTTDLPLLAGIASTLIYAASTLPMLVKARVTRDLSSYSLGNMLLANLGNAVNSVYVFSLPPGPIWALHSFYLLTTAQMFAWFLRYRCRPDQTSPRATAAARA